MILTQKLFQVTMNGALFTRYTFRNVCASFWTWGGAADPPYCIQYSKFAHTNEDIIWMLLHCCVMCKSALSYWAIGPAGGVQIGSSLDRPAVCCLRTILCKVTGWYNSQQFRLKLHGQVTLIQLCPQIIMEKLSSTYLGEGRSTPSLHGGVSVLVFLSLISHIYE